MRSTTTIASSFLLLLSTAATPALGQSNGEPVARAELDGKKASHRPAVDKQATQAARKFRSLVVDANRVTENVEKVIDRLHWYGSLGSALQSARAKNKPLLWIQALGDIDGFL